MPNAGIMASSVHLSGTCTDVLREPFSNLSAWTTTGTATIVGSGRTGTAVQITGTSNVAYSIGTPEQSEYLTFGMAFKTSHLPGTYALAAYYRTGVIENAIAITSSGAISAITGATQQAISEAGVVTTNTWYYVEWQVRNSPGSGGHVKVSLNGTEIINATGLNTRMNGIPDLLRLISISGMTRTYDDLYLSTGSACLFKGPQSMCNEVILEPFNNLTAWTTSGTPTITTGRTGNGVRFSAVGDVRHTVPTALQSTAYTFGFAVRMTSIASPTILAQLRTVGGGSNMYTLRVNDNGSLQAIYGATGSSGGGVSEAGLISVDTWYYIEMKVLMSNTAGTVEVRLNETPVIGPLTGIDTNGGFSEGQPAGVFALVGTSTVTVDYDDLYVTSGGCDFKGVQSLA